MQSSKRSPQNLYGRLATACAAVLLALLAAAFMLSRGLPIYQVVSFTGFGACLATLLGFALKLAIEDNRRSGGHSH